jgi:hypothetical protein
MCAISSYFVIHVNEGALLEETFEKRVVVGNTRFCVTMLELLEPDMVPPEAVNEGDGKM